MIRVAQELQIHSSAFIIPKLGFARSSVMDLCMAPGGFLTYALERNRGARAVALSLPLAQGGHKVLIPPSAKGRFGSAT